VEYLPVVYVIGGAIVMLVWSVRNRHALRELNHTSSAPNLTRWARLMLVYVAWPIYLAMAVLRARSPQR
jgi:hypothetical protein